MTPVPPQQSAVERLLAFAQHMRGHGFSVDDIESAASDLTRLKAKVEELERDRNEWEAKAISLFWACPDATKVGDVQKLKAKADSLLAAEAQVADLSARLARAVEVMRRVNPALSAAFQGGMEEREGGSANRQARYMESVDQLRADARAFLSEQENPHGNSQPETKGD